MLTDILNLLGLSEDTIPPDVQTQIETIQEIVETRLSVILGGIEEIPEELAYIVTEVSVVRYNRIGSEGVSSHSVEGESMTWDRSDFEPYLGEIQAWLDKQEDPSTDRGRVRFL